MRPVDRWSAFVTLFRVGPSLFFLGVGVGWFLCSHGCLAQARPYFLQPDGGLVAWDGGGP